MTTPANAGNFTIVVAVNFDKHTDALLAAATSFAKKFGADLRLVSAVQSHLEMAAFDYSATIYSYSNYAAAVEEDLAAETLKRLQQMAAALPVQRVTVAAPIGPTVPCLVAEAVAARAGLIIAACDPERFLTKAAGIATAIGLMHEAPLPVLIVSQGIGVDFNKPEFRILLADDLRPSTTEAARKAYELAARLGKAARLWHTHVHGDFREIVRDNWREARMFSTFLPKPSVPPDVAMRNEYEARIQRLKDHGQPWRTLAEEAGAKITLDVRTGNVGDEIHQVSSAQAPDVLVFGRHHLLRAKPFLIGRMPFKAMLHEKKPVLLVPANAELYANITLPAARA